MDNVTVNDDEGYEDDSFNDIDLSGFDKDNISLGLSNEGFLSNADLNTFFDNINDVS